MSWSNKKTLQTIGWVLIILGIILILISLIGSTQVYNCPPSRCAPSSLSSVPLYGDSFFIGIAVVIMGIILLFAARRMKPEEETDAPSRE